MFKTEIKEHQEVLDGLLTNFIKKQIVLFSKQKEMYEFNIESAKKQLDAQAKARAKANREK